MYGIVLMAALTAGGESAEFGRRCSCACSCVASCHGCTSCHSCRGCRRSCRASCHSCHGCYDCHSSCKKVRVKKCHGCHSSCHVVYTCHAPVVCHGAVVVEHGCYGVPMVIHSGAAHGHVVPMTPEAPKVIEMPKNDKAIENKPPVDPKSIEKAGDPKEVEKEGDEA